MVTGTVNAVYIFVMDWAIDLALTQSKTNLSRIFSVINLGFRTFGLVIVINNKAYV